MLEKFIMLIIIFSVPLAVDFSRIGHRQKRDIIAYSVVLLLAVYLGLDYIAEGKLPQLDTLLDWALTGPAKRIVEHLQTYS